MTTDPILAEGNVDGTQAIRRAAAILRQIGQSNSQGVSLSSLCEKLKLPRSTTHRILKCLVEEGLVRHEPERRRYVVGRLTYELGLAVTADALEIARWRGVVDRVAQRTGVTSYLLSRNGIEVTCVLKTEGNSAIRVIPVDVGQRRFLGAGAGATALLAALEPEVAERVIRTVVPLLGGLPGLTEERLRAMVDEGRRTGFVVSRSNVVRDAIGIGTAIPVAQGTPSLALSIAALSSQTDDGTVEKWKQILRQEIQEAL